MMNTPKKVAGNQANAAKSTGPRTRKGKKRSSRNSVQHGMLSQAVLVAWESRHSFQEFREGLLARLAPQDSLELMLADRVVAESWRMRRAGSYEAQVLDLDMREQKNDRKLDPDTYEEELPLSPPMIVRDMLKTDLLSKLSRYERRIERGMFTALHELERLQAARGDRPGAGDQPCRQGAQQPSPPTGDDRPGEGTATPGGQVPVN